MSKNTEPTLSLQAADFSISSIDPAISEAIRSNLTQVIESRLDSFRQRFSEENGATVVKTTAAKEKKINSSLISSLRCWTNAMKHRVL